MLVKILIILCSYTVLTFLNTDHKMQNVRINTLKLTYLSCILCLTGTCRFSRTLSELFYTRTFLRVNWWARSDADSFSSAGIIEPQIDLVAHSLFIAQTLVKLKKRAGVDCISEKLCFVKHLIYSTITKALSQSQGSVPLSLPVIGVYFESQPYDHSL